MTVWVEMHGKKRRVELGQAASDGFAICSVDGVEFAVDAHRSGGGMLSLVLPDGGQYRCVLEGGSVLVNDSSHEFTVVDPRSLAARRGTGAGAAGPRSLKAPMPGRVVRVLVIAGEVVEEQQGIMVIEAMKMQNELKSPKAGRVERVLAKVGDTVGSGDVLAVVD